jgi:hypothetical protein
MNAFFVSVLTTADGNKIVRDSLSLNNQSISELSCLECGTGQAYLLLAVRQYIVLSE